MPPMLPPLAERRPDLAVAAADLRLTIGSDAFTFATTAELDAPGVLLGQTRAVEALELGLTMRAPGAHVFAAGYPGTGRATAIAELLARIAPTLPVPPDRAYVTRFSAPDRPRLLTLPPGSGAVLAREVEELRRTLPQRLPLLLEDRELSRQRDALGKRYGAEEEQEFAGLRQRAEAGGFGLVQVDAGPLSHPEIVPVKDGQPVPLEQLRASLPPAEFAAKEAQLEALGDELRELARTSRDRQRRFAADLRELVASAARTLAEEEIADLGRHVPDLAIAPFLAELRDDIVAAVLELADARPDGMERLARRLERYSVNVVADRTGLTGAPVVSERFPGRQNLTGAVDRIQDGPMSFRADATTIRGGALLAADGGFLIVHAVEVLEVPGAWVALKRTLETGLLDIGAAGAGLLGLPRPLDPDQVPIDVKVVMVGERQHYDALWHGDPDFRGLFGIRADFSSDMTMGDEALKRYASVVAGVCQREHLPPAEAGAIGLLVEDGIARAGRRNRVSTSFGDTLSLVREAAHGAGETIGRDDVERALQARRRREGLMEERMQLMLEEGLVIVSTSGEAVGRVNGLSVYDLGYHAFGKPTRITASAAPGQVGIINVEREAKLSGNIYDKGVLIIAGFLRRRYADLGPLTLTASLAFEQSYAGVDGDSASIAEVVALLSELSGLPADGGLAITGSINQHGDVQPVGGVDHKITGFHALCAARGLDGTQGIVMPHQNVLDLMLPQGIVDDVAAGRFSVHAVEHVTDALEIALGVPMATVDERVRARLTTFAEALRGAAGDRPPSGATVNPPATPVPDPRVP
jgi:predicted ATP-dependent protease